MGHPIPPCAMSLYTVPRTRGAESRARCTRRRLPIEPPLSASAVVALHSCPDFGRRRFARVGVDQQLTRLPHDSPPSLVSDTALAVCEERSRPNANHGRQIVASVEAIAELGEASRGVFVCAGPKDGGDGRLDNAEHCVDRAERGMTRRFPARTCDDRSCVEPASATPLKQRSP